MDFPIFLSLLLVDHVPTQSDSCDVEHLRSRSAYHLSPPLFSRAQGSIMIMENLFYQRPHIGRVYDLKGSQRGRYVKDATSAGAVLMDENLLEQMQAGHPFLVRRRTPFLLLQSPPSFRYAPASFARTPFPIVIPPFFASVLRSRLP